MTSKEDAGLFARPVPMGLLIGVTFGAWNLASSLFAPLADDSVAAVLTFYGPMFLAWAALSFFAARRSGRLWQGIRMGTVVAFLTFCVYDLLVILRVNLFLGELTARSDWRALMAEFQASGSDDLRSFVNRQYLLQTPLKIFAASVIGCAMGVLGGSLGRLARPR